MKKWEKPMIYNLGVQDTAFMIKDGAGKDSSNDNDSSSVETSGSSNNDN